MRMKGPSLWKPFGLTIFITFILLSIAMVHTEDDLDADMLDNVDEAQTVVASKEEDEIEIYYESPIPVGDFHFAEHFDDVDSAKKRWVTSKAQKEEQDNVLKYEGKWDFDFPLQRIFPTDKALIMKSKAKLHAISAKLDKPFEFKDKPLIVQYEVNFQTGMDCGGAYIKLLTHSKDMSLNTFNSTTPYTIMFGPDKCGSEMKVHFIFRHKSPITSEFSEKHAKRPSNRLEETYSDKKPHLYRLKLTPDNKFELFVDERLINSGSLLEDMEPKVNPPMEIEDPNQVKPADWDEREKIPDPTAVKPDDWNEETPRKIPDPVAVPPAGWLLDEQEVIPDPTAAKPEDWEDSMDGTWEAPLISNPNCVGAPGCGEWSAPLIDNPDFKGKWKAPIISNPKYSGKWAPSKIPNPDYFEDKEPFKMTSIGAIGLELWTMSDQVLFDNFIVSNDQSVVDDWTSKTWELKRRVLDKDNEGVFRRLFNYSNAHPWLYAVYVLVIALPMVLIFTFCCGSSQEKKVDSRYKKTDEIVPDDSPEDAASPSVGRRSASVSTNSSSTPKTQASKDDLEYYSPPGTVPTTQNDSSVEDEFERSVNGSTESGSEEDVPEEKPKTKTPSPAEPPVVKKRGRGRPRKE